MASDDDSDDSDDDDDDSEAAQAMRERLSWEACRRGAADLYAKACAKRAAGRAGWQNALRDTARTRRRAEKELSRRGLIEPLRAAAGICDGCGAEHSTALCVGCTRAALGLPSTAAADPAFLSAFCVEPTVANLRHVLVDSDVRGDGSCWNYAVLAHGGHASASDARNGTHRTPPARAQLVSDRALRQAIARWCLANDGARRLANDDDADGRALAEVTTRAPLYGARGLLRHGGFGGDMQFVALADLLGCDIFTFDHAARGDATGVWYEHGESARGSRGRWTTGFGAVGRTLSAVVAHCARA